MGISTGNTGSIIPDIIAKSEDKMDAKVIVKCGVVRGFKFDILLRNGQFEIWIFNLLTKKPVAVRVCEDFDIAWEMANKWKADFARTGKLEE